MPQYWIDGRLNNYRAIDISNRVDMRAKIKERLILFLRRPLLLREP